MYTNVFQSQKDSVHNILATLRSEIGNCDYTSAILTSTTETLQIFPNPANDYLVIDGLQEGTLCKIFSMSGDCVLEILQMKNLLFSTLVIFQKVCMLLHF